MFTPTFPSRKKSRARMKIQKRNISNFNEHMTVNFCKICTVQFLVFQFICKAETDIIKNLILCRNPSKNGFLFLLNGPIETEFYLGHPVY